MTNISMLWFISVLVFLGGEKIAEIGLPVGGFESQAHCFAFSDGMDIEPPAEGYSIVISCDRP